jgi:hypothetical protein
VDAAIAFGEMPAGADGGTLVHAASAVATGMIKAPRHGIVFSS